MLFLTYSLSSCCKCQNIDLLKVVIFLNVHSNLYLLESKRARIFLPKDVRIFLEDNLIFKKFNYFLDFKELLKFVLTSEFPGMKVFLHS